MAYGPRPNPSVRQSYPDLDNYYQDKPLPPPHQLSPAASTEHLPPSSSQQYSNSRPTPPGAGYYPYSDSRGDYLAPEAAAAAAAAHEYNMSNKYQRASTWLQSEQKRSKRSKFIVIGTLVGIVVVIIIAVAAGVAVAKHKSNNNASASGGSGGSGGSSSGGGGTISDPNDPSKFTKDPNLHNAFYGIAYTPVGALLPDCGADQTDVIADIQIMSQITTRVRLYGSDCNVSALVLNAVKLTKVNLDVYLGIYMDPNDTVAYQRQKQDVVDAINTYGTDHIAGITVGNEYMLNWLTDNDNGAADPNSAIAQPAATFLINLINDMRTTLQGMNLKKTIQVGNSDAGAYFNTQIMNAIDYGMANVHPWFAPVTVDQAASWTFDFFDTNNLAAAANTTKKPDMYIAETGWPTQSSDAAHAQDGAGGPLAAASAANLQIFLDTFVCAANANNTRYFFFEFFDEHWKDVLYGGVEGWWGLFNANRTLKDVKIPTCSHP